MQATLVLDQSWQPINSVPWTRAMKYIAKGKVDVLKSYDCEVHFDMGMPAVVRIKHKINANKKRIRFSRQNVLARDHFKCVYCGAKGKDNELTFDHVIPKSKGGKTCWENIVISCVPCNHKKADRTLQEAGMILRTKPFKPTWIPIFNVALRNVSSIPKEWRDYWTVELSD